MLEQKERKKTIRSIGIYCILVMAMAFLGPLMGGSPTEPGPGFVLWGAAPLLAALLMRIFGRDWSDAGFRPAIRKNAKCYLACILVFPVTTVLSLLIGESVSASAFTVFSPASFLKTFLAALPVFFVFAVFEEFGWRGYLVPKLASAGANGFLSSAIIAVVWSTWHIPFIGQLVWVYNAEKLTTFLPRFYLAMFAFAILYNEVRILTGSVWPAVLMHCLANSFGHPLAADYVTIAPGMDYLVSASGILMILFIGGLGIALNRWRVGVRSSEAL